MPTETEQKYDSREDTLAHIERVADLLHEGADNLARRAIEHDASKLQEPEKSMFDECTARLKAMAYGSPEYKAALAELKPALDHHYAANAHHPEHFPKLETTPIGRMLRSAADEMEATAKEAMGSAGQGEINALLDFAKFNRDTADQLEAGVNGMSLFDVMEMLLDWKAATERMKGGGDIRRSLEINTERFKLSPQLASILANTIKEMGW
jgi:hypothetical protein